MTESNISDNLSEIESNLIKIAYSATLDPSKIVEFEKFWTVYIDAKSECLILGCDDQLKSQMSLSRMDSRRPLLK